MSRHKTPNLWTWHDMVDKFHFLNTLPFLDKENDNLILLSPSFFLLLLLLLALKHVDVSERLTVNYIVQRSPPLAWIHLSLPDFFRYLSQALTSMSSSIFLKVCYFKLHFCHHLKLNTCKAQFIICLTK